MFLRTNGLIFRGLADYLTSIWSNRAMWRRRSCCHEKIGFLVWKHICFFSSIGAWVDNRKIVVGFKLGVRCQEVWQ